MTEYVWGSIVSTADTHILLLCKPVTRDESEWKVELTQLKVAYTNLTDERDQLKVAYTNLTDERDQLLDRHNILKKQNDKFRMMLGNFMSFIHVYMTNILICIIFLT